MQVSSFISASKVVVYRFMKLKASVFFLATVVSLCHGKVVLKKGEHVTVTFEGDQLEIKLDNPAGQKGEFELCFRSTSDALSKSCPKGYISRLAFLVAREKTYKVNRMGQLFSTMGQLGMEFPIIFEADGSLKLMLANHPSTMVVYLPNAELLVVTTTTLALASTKSTDNKAQTGIICVIVILILAVLIIGAVLFYCLYNKRKHHPIRTIAPEEEAHQTRQEQEEPLRNKAVTKSPAPRPKPTHSTPLPSATTTTTKPPSTSTTKTSNEKPQAAVVQKPALTTAMQQTEEPGCVSIIPASAYSQRSTVVPVHNYGQNRV
uniref:Lysosome-associated membrane glycoprotein 3 n=1 Tax=Panagrellus redivivus TaxID=6233 RepID=A0A7E4V3E8_PANRE